MGGFAWFRVSRGKYFSVLASIPPGAIWVNANAGIGAAVLLPQFEATAQVTAADQVSAGGNSFQRGRSRYRRIFTFNRHPAIPAPANRVASQIMMLQWNASWALKYRIGGEMAASSPRITPQTAN